MVCELCGNGGPLVRAKIEGTELTVCQHCGKYGTILKQRDTFTPRPQRSQKPEIIEAIVDNYAQLIREAREKKRLTQQEFARAINEKESVIQKIENGAFRPPISTARKLEKLLSITLVEIQENKKVELNKKQSGPLTIGDIINIRS